ncbi:MAG: hypothetical protein VW338_00185 [Rhodospirillaceae bacterium]
MANVEITRVRVDLDDDTVAHLQDAGLLSLDEAFDAKAIASALRCAAAVCGRMGRRTMGAGH